MFEEAHPVKPYIMMFAQLQYKINFAGSLRQARCVIGAAKATKGPVVPHDLCRICTKRCRSAS